MDIVQQLLNCRKECIKFNNTKFSKNITKKDLNVLKNVATKISEERKSNIEIQKKYICTYKKKNKSCNKRFYRKAHLINQSKT